MNKKTDPADLTKTRCAWCSEDPIYIKYHDEEWGVPKHDDQELFELLSLEIMQAGLSWITILKKRSAFRRLFDGFNVKKISLYDQDKLDSLMKDESIVRNEKKIRAIIKNARVFIQIQKTFGSFDKYIWSFVDNKPLLNNFSDDALPSKSLLSEKISKDLKSKGMVFVGPIIIYSFLQAVGIINDHSINCFLSPVT